MAVTKSGAEASRTRVPVSDSFKVKFNSITKILTNEFCDRSLSSLFEFIHLFL